MNEHTHYPGQGGGDAALRLSLRGLRQDRDPGHDLWPGIEARIRALPQVHAPASRQRSPWPLAMAASMLLAAGVAWQMRPAEVPLRRGEGRVAATLVQREASTMTVQYRAALRELDVHPAPAPASWQPGLAELDRSAAEIRSALQQNPDSRLLLERLRETYTRRLALSRRALYA